MPLGKKKAAAKAPSKKPAPKKAAPPPAKKEKAAAPAVAPKKMAPPPVAPEPTFVKQASFAEKKAALEAHALKEGLPKPALATPPAPPPPPSPTFVRESSPAERKAALEKVVAEEGVTSVLAKAPWKRGPAPTPTPAPAPANPAERTGPKVQMTKAPLAQPTGVNPRNSVILDSNALMMQFQFHIDIEKEVNRILGGNYEVIVPSIVVGELERLAKDGTGKETAEARMAAELARTFKVVDAPGDGDVGILKLAEQVNAVVVTNDKRLRATLRAKGIPNIYMRSRAFLTIEGHIPGM